MPQKGRFTRHVWPGQQPDRSGVFVRQGAAVGDERGAGLLAQGGFDNGMAAAFDHKPARVVQPWTGPILGPGQISQRGGHVEFGKRRGGLSKLSCGL